MDGQEKVGERTEMSMSEKKTSNGGGDLLIKMPNEDTPGANLASKTSKPEAYAKSVSMSCPSPEISRFSPSPNKPPRIPMANDNLTRRRSFARSGSLLSKPKSRFGAPAVTVGASVVEEDSVLEQLNKNYSYKDSLSKGSPNNRSASSIRTNSMNQKTPAGEDEEEEIYKKVELSKEKHRKFNAKILIELVVFFCLVGCLIASLSWKELRRTTMWELEVWKWCVLVMVTFCGMLVTNWLIHVMVFLIEKNFMLRKKVLYFVHGLKKSVQVFIWISLVLLAWVLLFNHGVKRSDSATRILNYVTWTLVSLLIGSFLWLLKTLLLKILASSFHVNTFFDRIQVSVFHQYVLQTLSGPPLIEEAMMVGREPSTGQLSFRNTKKGKTSKEKKVIDMGKIYEMKKEKVSAWTMKVLVDAITNSGLSTISNTLEESVDYEGGEQTDKEITNEMEATHAAYQIFRNVVQPGSKYIEEEDLLRFMIKEEVDIVFPLFEGYESGRIDRKALTDWVLKVYNGRKALGHALSDTKTAVRQLNKLVSAILIVATIIIWFLLMEIASTKILLLLSSQILVAGFMFKNVCKTIFEAIIFVFVMHPFDVGDRCVIDGVPLLVEEMNILTTVFLKLDNEKVYYPNSVLATKPISNYFRSPDMGDNVEFSIDFATPVEKIGLLKDKIKEYLERTPQHWHPNHSIVVKEIENVNKLKLVLYCVHTINYQEYAEKNSRRTELVMEIKRIFEELSIRYYLLPQRIQLNPISPDQLILPTNDWRR